MHLDGNIDNSFPWMSSSSTTTSSPQTASPHDRDVSPTTPGRIPPTPGVPPTPGALVDPPRPPKYGFEWVWFPGSYWAEREIIISPAESPSRSLDSKLRRWKAKSSKGSQGSVDLEQSPISPRESESRRGSGGSITTYSPQPQTPYRAERDLVQTLQQPSDSPEKESLGGYPFHAVTPSADNNNDSLSSPASTVKEYRRGSWPETQTILEEPREDDTGSQGSTTPLGRLMSIGRSREKRKSRSSERGPLDDTLSESSDGHTPAQQSSSRKLLKKLSWRKKESPADPDSLSLIEEEGTAATQSPQQLWNSVYPAGEARRITTPPLKEATADGRVRSLFTDIDNFNLDETRPDADTHSQMSSLSNGGNGSIESDTRSSSESYKLNEAYRKAAAAAANSTEKIQSHWFDSKIAEDDEERHFLRAKKQFEKRMETFALAVPEHLPTSPLCPANPKHVSGGHGVCVYHGRRQDLTESKQKPFVIELGLQQPATTSQQLNEAMAYPVPKRKVRTEHWKDVHP